ncbi:hypothetical protein ABF81_05330 [Enterobacter hormaechei subsp. steigerwaltii]|nr:hypothetical protein ABF81_05330 [Enterobacter hormaechei subsp. steigerwaltii]
MSLLHHLLIHTLTGLVISTGQLLASITQHQRLFQASGISLLIASKMGIILRFLIRCYAMRLPANIIVGMASYQRAYHLALRRKHQEESDLVHGLA